MRRIRKNDQLRAMVHSSLPITWFIQYLYYRDNPRYSKYAKHSAFVGRFVKAERLLELGVSKLALFPVKKIKALPQKLHGVKMV